MINEIKTAVKFAHKDNGNGASNVLIKDGVLQCHDHISGISLAVDSDLDFCCNANKLNTVLSKCDPEKLAIKIVKGKIEIKSGRFKSKIDLYPIENYPVFAEPGSDSKECPSIIVDLKQLSVFTDPDDVRPFATGVCIDDGALIATNGHVAVKKSVDIETKYKIIIPTKSIAKIASAKIECDELSWNEKLVYFIFNGGFLFAKTINFGYPDVAKIITEMSDNKQDIKEFEEDLKTIQSLCDIDRTVKLGESISSRDESTTINGYSFNECAFNVDYLIAIATVANEIDFSTYPAPCPFKGDNITGAVVGVKI